MNLNCPFCGGQTRIMETRGNTKVVLRRRKCLSCDRLSYTEELLILDPAEGSERLQRLRYELYPNLKKLKRENRNGNKEKRTTKA